VQTPFAVLGGADLDAAGVNVKNMQGAASVFSVLGTDTVANIRGSTVSDNTIAGGNWTIVNAQNGSTVDISNTTFSGNNGVRSLLSAVGPGTTLSASSVTSTNDVGGLQAVSTLQCFT
jgi:hypothetical protein